MSHPNSLDLEAFACGEDASAIADHVGACEACRGFVDRLRALPAPPMPDLAVPELPRRRSPWATVTTIGVPLAAAAVLLLLLREPNRPEAPPTEAPVATGTSEPGTSFKGSLQVAVIRERNGEQKRFTGRVPVREGDRLRVEVAIDREQAILAAVEGDDGSYIELMPRAVRAPGTHYSEKSARVSGPPSNGKIVVGDTTIRVEWEGTP